MEMKYNFVFLLLLCSYCADSRADPEAYVAIENGLKSLSNVVVRYQSEFDMKVKFVPLQEAIDTIDRAMLGYQGIAKNKLKDLHKTNKDARLAYQNCVGPVFEWCVSINRTLDLFIPYMGNEELTNGDRNIIWHMNIDALKDGQNKVSTSLELLKSVQNKTTNLKNLLDAILQDLHNDFAPSGVYGKQTNRLEDSLKQNKALELAAAINIIFNVIADFTRSPIGVLLVLPLAFLVNGLQEVIERKRKATLEEQLRTIYTFFAEIEAKIANASAITDEVNLHLEEDKNNLYALATLISVANKNNEGLLSNLTYRRRLVPSFQDLGSSCYEYTIWHGYGSTGYQHKKRAKRHAMEACKSDRWKALETRMKSFPSNTTFATIVSQAHSILMEMDCEEINLPSLDADEIFKMSLRSPNNPSKIKSPQSKPMKNIIANYLKYV